MSQTNELPDPAPLQDLPHPEVAAAARAYIHAVKQVRVGLAVVCVTDLLYVVFVISGGFYGFPELEVLGTVTVVAGIGFYGFAIGSRVRTSDWLLSVRRTTATPWLPHLSLDAWARALLDGSWSAGELPVHDEGQRRDRPSPTQL